MSEFYISDADVRKCNQSRDGGRIITVSGETAEGRCGAFTGIAQAVLIEPDHPPTRRNQVTMKDKSPPVWSAPE